MRAFTSLLALLLLPAFAMAGEETASAPPSVYSFAGGERLVPDSVRIIARRPLPPSRDMALGRFGDLMLLSREGELFTLNPKDSLTLQAFSGDLRGGYWPESVGADGFDWLLLVRQGQALLRLGRRGEALGQIEVPALDAFWRDLKVDRSGRIWLADESSGRFALLSRGGQLLQEWDFERRLPGFTVPVLAWCPDQHGGLYLAEGWPLRLHHINGAGNSLALWHPTLPEGELALGTDERDRLLVAVCPSGSELHMACRGHLGELFLKTEEELWILERAGKGP